MSRITAILNMLAVVVAGLAFALTAPWYPIADIEDAAGAIG